MRPRIPDPPMTMAIKASTIATATIVAGTRPAPHHLVMPRWGGCWLTGGPWQSVGMLIEHPAKTPQVDPSACVAPTAVVCAAVRIGADAGILIGAVLTAEDGVIGVGDRTVVMENAPREVAGYAAARRIDAWSGHNYAWELTESPGIRDSGSAVRVGLVHCNDRSDVDCLPEAVADLDGDREFCGDLPG
jgi:hypothetical protein